MYRVIHNTTKYLLVIIISKSTSLVVVIFVAYLKLGFQVLNLIIHGTLRVLRPCQMCKIISLSHSTRWNFSPILTLCRVSKTNRFLVDLTKIDR
jgi:hypothetical protein